MSLYTKRGVIIADLGSTNEKNISSFVNIILKDLKKRPKRSLISFLFPPFPRKSCKVYENNLQADLAKEINAPVLYFRRYNRDSHGYFFEMVKKEKIQWIILPLMPHFSHFFTGNIAKFFARFLPKKDLLWIKSYSMHKSFISAFQKNIRDFLDKNALKEEETILLFVAQGVREKFMKKELLYKLENEVSYKAILKYFPLAFGRLSFLGDDLGGCPSTNSLCKNVETWKQNRKNLLFIPFSFTNNHFETNRFIEEELFQYALKSNLKPFLASPLDHNPIWIKTLYDILLEKNFVTNEMLTGEK